MHPGQVPDPRAIAAQQRVIDAQKELKSIEFAQSMRDGKVKNAINFLLLPLQTKDGVVRQEPEYDDEVVRPHVVAARCAAYDCIATYFKTTTDFEDGLPVHEAPSTEFAIAQ
jgi:hypothetical protein